MAGHDNSLDVEEIKLSYGSQDINDWHLCIVKKKDEEKDQKAIMDEACNFPSSLSQDLVT